MRFLSTIGPRPSRRHRKPIVFGREAEESEYFIPIRPRRRRGRHHVAGVTPSRSAAEDRNGGKPHPGARWQYERDMRHASDAVFWAACLSMVPSFRGTRQSCANPTSVRAGTWVHDGRRSGHTRVRAVRDALLLPGVAALRLEASNWLFLSWIGTGEAKLPARFRDTRGSS